jgi:hypothetical protein
MTYSEYSLKFDSANDCLDTCRICPRRLLVIARLVLSCIWPLQVPLPSELSFHNDFQTLKQLRLVLFAKLKVHSPPQIV